jgi:cytidylate kinase
MIMSAALPPLVVAIDGPAAAGKSTTARAVAARLGLRWIDTGAMYRAVTLWLLRHGIPPAEGADLERALRGIEIDLAMEGRGQRVLLCGEDVTAKIRDQEVTRQVSRVAALPQVRRALVKWQRGMAAKGNVVVEGRDIGTVVLPDAPVKVFLVASLEERAKRRQRDLKQGGEEVESAAVQEEIQRRDDSDSSREHSPLQPARDAFLLDTTHLSFEEQVREIVRLVHEKGYRAEFLSFQRDVGNEDGKKRRGCSAS